MLVKMHGFFARDRGFFRILCLAAGEPSCFHACQGSSTKKLGKTSVTLCAEDHKLGITGMSFFASNVSP